MNTIKIKYHGPKDISIKVNVEDKKILRQMIARLVLTYGGGKLYNQGTKIRFKV